MKDLYIDYIINTMTMRLQYNYDIILESDQIKKLRETISRFSDEDYNSVSDNLTSTIEDDLLSFGLDIHKAIRESWKWSD